MAGVCLSIHVPFDSRTTNAMMNLDTLASTRAEEKLQIAVELYM